MSFTYGFYNSLNGDRKYNARHMSQLFDGIINDGIFMSIGTSLIVKAGEGMIVNVGIGRAWFNGTWSHNDAIMPVKIPESDLLLNRIDAVVLEVNTNDNVRANAIKVVMGTAATAPLRPTLSMEDGCYQYPLAYVEVKGAVEAITQANITNMVGTEQTPFVTGVLETMNIDALIAQWGTQWNEWFDDVQATNTTWTNSEKQKFLDWAANERSTETAWIQEFENDVNTFRNTSKSDFVTWFNNVKGQLSTDVAGNLQNEVDDIIRKEFEDYYGMVNKTTVISTDSSGAKTITETTDDASAVTTFGTNSSGKVITTVLTPTNQNWLYTKTTTINKADSGTTITETYERTIKG